MADHYVAIARGVEGSDYNDFITGTVSSAATLFEFRVFDNSAPNIPTKVEVLKALKAFERFFENAQQASAAGFVIKG
jgi:hypothetical protein